MFNKIFGNHIIRYVVAGGASYAIELGCLLTLHYLAGLSVVAATAIAFWVGLALSFLFQKIFAFKDFQKEVRAISRQIVAYAILVLINYCFTLIVVGLFPKNWVIVSRTIALIITTIWNYSIYKKLIFVETQPLARVRFKKWLSVHRKVLVFSVLFSIPVLLFFYQYIFTGNGLVAGDFDYYAQMYEAFRISLLHYHQLPLWNPWMSGGVPLFANPQFGLISIQSLLVLPLGAIYGLKIAYVLYALAGFWGMYVFCTRIFGSSKWRALLVSYIWIFSGFFAGHNIVHFTFSLFFLLPWLLYFTIRRNWLGLGLLEALIILSSIHYAFLMTGFVVVVIFVLSLLRVKQSRHTALFSFTKKDGLFVAKTLAVIIVLSGYRFLLTYFFVRHNPKIPALLIDHPNSPILELKTLFLPIDIHIPVPHGLQWGWGEYSAYIGVGAGLALIVALLQLIKDVLSKKGFRNLANPRLVLIVILVGIITFALALGDHGSSSPFQLLRLLPGFSDTRVAARWIIFSAFTILVFLAAWRKNRRLVNVLLLLSVVELFFSYGPPTDVGQSDVSLPKSQFSSNFTDYNNSFHHLGVNGDKNINDSYYFSTTKNVGQIYSDDSLVDTLDKVIGTARCASNTERACNFVQTGNAVLTYWSPNKITVKRTAPGNILLNMNVSSGWRVNNGYPFALNQRLDPTTPFVLGGNFTTYNLVYAPKFSPSWLAWRIEKF